MNIIQERLEREFSLNLISTAPSVSYKVIMNDGEEVEVDNPSKLPDQTLIEQIKEPMVNISIHVPNDFVGSMIQTVRGKKRAAAGNSLHYRRPRSSHVQVTFE